MGMVEFREAIHSKAHPVMLNTPAILQAFDDNLHATAEAALDTKFGETQLSAAHIRGQIIGMLTLMVSMEVYTAEDAIAIIAALDKGWVVTK